MGSYNKFDPKLESLVMETRTLWKPEVAEQVSEEDKNWLAHELHRNPRLASTIVYERSHTGFTRVITVGLEDIERLYNQRVAEAD